MRIICDRLPATPGEHGLKGDTIGQAQFSLLGLSGTGRSSLVESFIHPDHFTQWQKGTEPILYGAPSEPGLRQRPGFVQDKTGGHEMPPLFFCLQDEFFGSLMEMVASIEEGVKGAGVDENNLQRIDSTQPRS